MVEVRRTFKSKSTWYIDHAQAVLDARELAEGDHDHLYVVLTVQAGSLFVIEVYEPDRERNPVRFVGYW